MMKYFGRLLLMLLLFAGVSACSPKQKMIHQVKKEQRFIRKMEYKELRRHLRSYRREKRTWYKSQPKEVQKRLKEQQRQTKKFYKPYGKAKPQCTPPGITPTPHSRYKRNGIK
jgi:cytochrome c biogenesis protein ResB